MRGFPSSEPAYSTLDVAIAGLLTDAAVATRRLYDVLDEKAQIHQRTVYRAHIFGTGRVPCKHVRDCITVHAWV